MTKDLLLVLLLHIISIPAVVINKSVDCKTRVLSFMKNEFSKSEAYDLCPLSSLDELVVEDVGKISYKCFSAMDPSKAVLVKYHVNTKVDCASSPLQSESVGIQSFARYTPKLIPKFYLYNDTYEPSSSYLVTEYLHGFRPLQDLFINGDMDIDAATFIGTVMGRNHAKTFHLTISNEQRVRYEKHFTNEQQLRDWDNDVFVNTLRLLSGESGREDEDHYTDSLPTDHCFSPLQYLETLRNGDGSDDGDGSGSGGDVFIRAVTLLRGIHQSNKQTLVHGGLHSRNILFAPADGHGDSNGNGNDNDNTADTEALRLRLVNFEGCSFGSAGLDLGIFLASYMWYYVAHSDRPARRCLQQGMQVLVEAYKAAFRVQMNSLKSSLIQTSDGNVSVETEAVINEVVVDAIGFAGLQMLHYVVEGDRDEYIEDNKKRKARKKIEKKERKVRKERQKAQKKDMTREEIKREKEKEKGRVKEEEKKKDKEKEGDEEERKRRKEVQKMKGLKNDTTRRIDERESQGEMSAMSRDGVPGLQWGDREGRERSVDRRTLSMTHDLFEIFLSLKKEGVGVCDGNDIACPAPAYYSSQPLDWSRVKRILLKDDDLMLTDHPTEFW